MDVFLAWEAYEEIKAILLWGKKPGDGLLLGHHRGPRVFIEKTWPTKKGFFTSAAHYWQIEQVFAGRVVGFFSYLPAPERAAKVLQPLGYGKVFLKISLNRKNALHLKSFYIDFDGAFHLVPCPLEIEPRGNDGAT